MSLRLKLLRNAVVAYLVLGGINYLGIRSQVDANVHVDVLTTLLLWPLSRLPGALVIGEVSFVGITAIQVVVVLIYFFLSFVSWGVELGIEANRMANIHLQNPRFVVIINAYLYQKRDMVEQYPQLTSQNFTYLMDHLIGHDLDKLQDLLLINNFQMNRLTLQAALRIQSRPIYGMMKQELALRDQDPYGISYTDEISAEEIERLR